MCREKRQELVRPVNAKFGLEVAVEKTNIILFDRSSKLRFEFLGFEIYWDKNCWGKIVLKKRTSRKKYRASIANFKAWCKKHRHLPESIFFGKLNRNTTRILELLWY